VTDLTGARAEPLLQLSGAALGMLSGRAKRRLLATALGEPRRRPLDVRADHGALGLYLSLTLPRARRVVGVPSFRIGAIGRDGRSIALLETRPTPSEVDVAMSYGVGEAEAFLLERVHEWDVRGRPGESDLRIEVTYNDDVPRLAFSWPQVVRRGS
jgi:hypothetical protein